MREFEGGLRLLRGHGFSNNLFLGNPRPDVLRLLHRSGLARWLLVLLLGVAHGNGYWVKVVALNATLTPMVTTVLDPNGCLETLTTKRVSFVKGSSTFNAYLIEGASDCKAVPVTVSCPCGFINLAPLQAVTTQCLNGKTTYLVTASNLPSTAILAPFLQNFLRFRRKGKKYWKRSSRS